MNSPSLLLKTAFSFITLLFACNPVVHAQVKMAPYIEDFNSSPWVGYYAYSQNYANTSSVFDPSWSRSHGDGSNYHWQVLYGRQYINVNSGPKGGHPSFSGNYLAARRILGQNNTDTVSFTTPKVDVSNLVDPYFSFYYHRHGSSLPELIVDINDGSGWQQIYKNTIPTHFSNDAPYQISGQSLSAFRDTVEVRFSAVSNGCCYSIMAIDDVSFIEGPSCPEIEDLDIALVTDTSALVSWSASASAIGYIVYKKVANQLIYHGENSLIIDTVSNTSLLIDDLAINTCYQISVRAYCGPNDTGLVPNPVEVCTPELRAYSLPFYHPLNSWPANHWNVAKSKGFFLQNLSGGNYLQASPQSSWVADSAVLNSPFIYLDSKARVRFLWSRFGGTNFNDTMKVYIRELGQTTWSQILVKTGTNFSDTSSSIGLPGNFVEEIIPLDSAAYTGKMVEIVIAYYVDNLASQPLYLKDFVVEKPFTTDLELVSAKFFKNSACSIGNDSISIIIGNPSDSIFYAQKQPFTLKVKIEGLLDSIQTKTFSLDTISPLSQKEFWITGFDLSESKVYYIVDVQLYPNSFNASSLNDRLNYLSDTILIKSNLDITPNGLIILTTQFDTTMFTSRSNFFTGGDFVFSEVCHDIWATGGRPNNVWPIFLINNDYFEISGPPGANLQGFTFELWGIGSNIQHSYTFNSSTPLGPNGTATFSVNFAGTDRIGRYYGVGRPTFPPLTLNNNNSYGYILKDQNDSIVDAVGFGSNFGPYVFPANSNVTSQKWSGIIPFVPNTAGIRLEGEDLNNATNWTTADLSPQNPNNWNPNLLASQAIVDSSFYWSYNGDTISTKARLVVGPYQNSGYHHYLAHFSNYCGVFVDTATVLVNLPSIHCGVATNLNVKDVSCTWADISWSKNGSDSAIVEIGNPNFFPGLNQMNQLVGTTKDSLRIDQLEAGKSYDIWIRNFCGTDTSAWDGPISFTTPTGPSPIADFSISQIMNGNSLDLRVDASNSNNAENYTWIYGNNTSGSGLLDSLTILNNGSFDITLIVENACGIDSLSKTIFVNIGIDENDATKIQRIEVYPNPTKDILTIDIINLGEHKILTAHFYDLQGKELIRTEINVDKAFTQSKLNLGGYSSGLYILVIEGDRKSWEKKVLID